MCGQLCGYLKNYFAMRLQHMAQNSFFMDAIEHEAMQVEVNAHCHNWLSGKKYCAKNYSDLLNNFLRFISNHFVAVSVSFGLDIF